jgi:hypothetical protein
VSEVARSMARESVTEVVQENLQYAAESVGTDAGFNPQEAIERSLTAGIVGMGMGGAITTVTAPLQAVENRRRRNMTEELKGKFEQADIDKQIELMQGLQLRQLSPPKLQEYLATISDGKSLYLSPDVLAELEAKGTVLPFLDGKGDGEQDIQITYSDLNSVLDDKAVMDVLRPHLKRTPGTMSPAEIEAAQGARETVTAAEINGLIEIATQDQTLRSEVDKIHEQVMQGIVATGRQGPATARISAETIPAYITAKIDELQRERGVTLSPTEAYEMMGLRIEKMTGAPDPAGVQQTGTDEPTGPALSEIEITDEYVDDDGNPATVSLPADKALEDIDTRMDNAKKLIACLRS